MINYKQISNLLYESNIDHIEEVYISKGNDRKTIGIVIQSIAFCIDFDELLILQMLDGYDNISIQKELDYERIRITIKEDGKQSKKM